MANLAKRKAVKPVRMMILGSPGMGKTGSLAALANAGFKLRILDFDGNLEPLYQYCTPQGLANIDAVYFEEKMRMNASGIQEPVSVPPMAFRNAMKMMDHWTYKDTDGEVVDLGKSPEWGLDTIVVLDKLDGMEQALFARARVMTNKTMLNQTQRTWGFAASDQNEFISKLTSDHTPHHVIVLSGLKMIGPREVGEKEEGQSRDIKEQEADLITTRYYPAAIGRQLPQNIAGHFPVVIKAEAVYGALNSAKRVFRHKPMKELDLKLPVPELSNELDVADGLLTIFKALGANPPNHGDTK